MQNDNLYLCLDVLANLLEANSYEPEKAEKRFNEIMASLPKNIMDEADLESVRGVVSFAKDVYAIIAKMVKITIRAIEKIIDYLTTAIKKRYSKTATALKDADDIQTRLRKQTFGAPESSMVNFGGVNAIMTGGKFNHRALAEAVAQLSNYSKVKSIVSAFKLIEQITEPQMLLGNSEEVNTSRLTTETKALYERYVDEFKAKVQRSPIEMANIDPAFQTLDEVRSTIPFPGNVSFIIGVKTSSGIIRTKKHQAKIKTNIREVQALNASEINEFLTLVREMLKASLDVMDSLPKIKSSIRAITRNLEKYPELAKAEGINRQQSKVAAGFIRAVSSSMKTYKTYCYDLPDYLGDLGTACIKYSNTSLNNLRT